MPSIDEDPGRDATARWGFAQVEQTQRFAPDHRRRRQVAWRLGIGFSVLVLLAVSWLLVAGAFEQSPPSGLDLAAGAFGTALVTIGPAVVLLVALKRWRAGTTPRAWALAAGVSIAVLVGALVMFEAMVPTRVRFASHATEMEKAAQQTLDKLQGTPPPDPAKFRQFLRPATEPGYEPGTRIVGWLVVYSTDVGLCRDGYATSNALDDFGVFFHLGPNPYADDILVYCPQPDVDLPSATGASQGVSHLTGSWYLIEHT